MRSGSKNMSFTNYHLYFDDVEVGQEWETQGRTVTETDIVNFAGLSGDFNPIHVDHEFAESTPFRRPIAHGLLIQAISSGLGCRMNSAISALRLRKNPDFVGRPSVLARKSALSLTGRATT